MKAVSPAFLEAITRSHRAIVAAQVLGHDDALAPTDGSVTLDATAAVRGRLDLEFAGADLLPVDSNSLLAPYGNEIKVWRGVQLQAGPELVPLGVFRIDETKEDDSGAGIIVRVTALDRAARIIDAKFEEPYQVAAGTNVVTAVLDVVQASWPNVPHNLTTSTRTTPLLLAQENDDRWAFCQDLMTSIGMVLYFDGDGVLTSRPISALQMTPAWALNEGDGGSLLTVAQGWARGNARNRWIVTGENTGEGAPVRGVATDDNPASPTFYNGPFGRVPDFYNSEFVTTDDQAVDVAQALLFRQLGITQSADFGSLVNPALEPDDVVRVTRAASGLDEAHIIDQLVIPLSVATGMTGVTRQAIGNA